MQILDLKIKNAQELFDDIIMNYKNDKLGIKRLKLNFVIRPNVVFRNCNNKWILIILILFRRK